MIMIMVINFVSSIIRGMRPTTATAAVLSVHRQRSILAGRQSAYSRQKKRKFIHEIEQTVLRVRASTRLS